MSATMRLARSNAAWARARWGCASLGLPRNPLWVLAAMVYPDLPVAGMVGGLRAARRVAHSHQGLIGVGGAGDLEAECLGGIGEPAVVTDADVQRAGLGLQDTFDPSVVDDGDRPGVVAVQGVVHGRERGGEFTGALSGGGGFRGGGLVSGASAAAGVGALPYPARCAGRGRWGARS